MSGDLLCHSAVEQEMWFDKDGQAKLKTELQLRHPDLTKLKKIPTHQTGKERREGWELQA